MGWAAVNVEGEIFRDRNACDRQVRRLVVEDVYPDFPNYRLLVSAICEMAAAIDFLKENPHPYGGSAPVAKTGVVA